MPGLKKWYPIGFRGGTNTTNHRVGPLHSQATESPENARCAKLRLVLENPSLDDQGKCNPIFILSWFTEYSVRYPWYAVYFYISDIYQNASGGKDDREISGDFGKGVHIILTCSLVSGNGKCELSYCPAWRHEMYVLCTPYDRDGPYSVGEIVSGASGEKRKGLFFHLRHGPRVGVRRCLERKD